MALDSSKQRAEYHEAEGCEALVMPGPHHCQIHQGIIIRTGQNSNYAWYPSCPSGDRGKEQGTVDWDDLFDGLLLEEIAVFSGISC